MDEIIALLGEPYFKCDNCLLYNMDCLVGLEKIKSSNVKMDLTITSPPYNIGKEYEEVMDHREYVDWCRKWIELIYFATSSSGAFWLNLGYLSIPGEAKCLPLPYLLWNHNLFQFVQEVVWNYGAGVACKKYLSPRNEKFLWYVKDLDNYVFNLDDIRDPDVKYPNQKRKGVLRCNPNGKNPTDVWQIPKVTSGEHRSSPERTAHPAQFPVALVERVMRCSSNAGDLVLDPFMGSGTTAEVALRLGRRVVGFEIKKEYCDIAVARINSVLDSMKEENVEPPLKKSKE